MSTATEPPSGTAPAAKRGGRLAPVTHAFESVTRLLPTWAWGVFWMLVAILYGLYGDTFNDSLYESTIQTLAYVMMALGLNIVVGFAGLLDLGYVAFFAIGAFVSGWFMSGFYANSNIHILVSDQTKQLPGIHINFFFVICIAAAFTAMWGAILGAPTLRLRGDYLAIVTLAFGEIVPRVFELSTSGPFGIGNLDISNGRQGITPVDKPYFPVPGLDNITRIDITPFYFIALGMMLVVLFVNVRLRDSRLGRAWIAVREDEVAAAAMGVHLVRVKLWAYAIGASIGGFAGVFLGVFQNTINVDQFEFGFSVFILCMIILGGMGNLAGVILGAVALSMINRFLLPELNGVPEKFGLNFDVTAISFGIFGFLLLVMMVLRPEGFIPNRRRKIELHEDEFDDTLISVKSP
ncbi:MAG: branched-chain amino acid transport system permease protein [Solirubrobacteraceae bacterium]|jgi:branched-chain amino acid transport system permease protein|nr:branched-chain amino acid transport system permease protein [Solirubrobacteraceae bacterium]